MFSNKIILITGGTGSFGNAVLRKFLNTGIKEIRIFSRDEKKQDDMRQFYKNEKIKYYIGDVRNKRSVDYAMNGVDYIFHAAALKQVPSCEFFPMEAVQTNIIGCENVIDSAILHGVKKVIVLSTDKAVYPINAIMIPTYSFFLNFIKKRSQHLFSFFIREPVGKNILIVVSTIVAPTLLIKSDVGIGCVHYTIGTNLILNFNHILKSL